MARFKGINKKLYLGDETTYGTLDITDMMVVNYSAETLKQTLTKEKETSLIVEKTANAFKYKGSKVEGDITCENFKPDNNKILKYGLYEAAAPTTVATGVYKHTLVLYPIATTQSVASAIIQRGAANHGYAGLVFNKYKFEIKGKSNLSLTSSVIGYGSESVVSTLPTGLTDPSKQTYDSFSSSLSIGGVALGGDITDMSIEIDNSAATGDSTLGDGYYNPMAVHGEKTVSISMTSYYNSEIETIRATNLAANNYLAVDLVLQSPELIATVDSVAYPYKIEFTMPACSFTEVSQNVGSTDWIKSTISANATGYGSVEPLTICVTDATAEKY